MNKTKIALLIPSILLLILGAYFLWVARGLSSDYQWAASARFIPKEIYDAEIVPIIERFEKYFYIYVIIGFLSVFGGLSGLVLSNSVIRKEKLRH